MIIKEQSHRVKRGTKASDLPSQRASTPPPLDSLDGPFRLAEYLAYNVWRDPHDVQRLVELPKGDDGEPSQDKNVWIYEHLRRLPIDLTPLLTGLLPQCTKESCPQMRANEWMYLCVAHGGSGTEECSAIDYILHTVDSTATLLNSSKSFPSRMSIPNSSLSHFPSLFRRISRIFSHAYYRHREAFSLAEAENSLYARFVALCETYDLVGSNLLVIPKSAISNLGEPSHSEPEDEDEPSSEESEDAQDDEAEGSRGRDGEGKEKERRTQSLDRDPLLENRGERRKELAPKTPATTSDTTPQQTAKHDPGGLDRSKTVKTLGRGKQTRGTMLWSSDTPPVPTAADSTASTTSDAEPPPTSELERTESRDTVVHLSPETKDGLLPPIDGVKDTEPSSSDPENESSKEGSTANNRDMDSEDAPPPESGAILSNAGQTEEGAPAPAASTVEEKKEGGEMVDIKLDDPETTPSHHPTTSTAPAVDPSDSPAPRSPNPELSPSRSKSAHGAGRLSKPSTPAKSFVASAKSPAAPLLSTGGSGDSPAKSGESTASPVVPPSPLVPNADKADKADDEVKAEIEESKSFEEA